MKLLVPGAARTQELVGNIEGLGAEREFNKELEVELGVEE